MALHRVYEPILINGVEIPNRIARSAHGTGLTGRGPINDEFIDYHLARAKGGVGLTILEATTVHPSSVVALASFDDGVIDGYRRLMAAIRPHGMRIFQQIWHAGHIYPLGDMSPPWGVSSVPDPMTGIVPVPMGKGEIEEVIASFAAAARRSREGGIEGIEVHAAHGYLIMQFLSPLTNVRSDEYGGSLENRMRLLREILVAVRKEVGADYPVGIRVAASLEPGGIHEAELGIVARTLRDERLIDFLDVSMGDYYVKQPIVGAMDRPTGYQLPSSSQITAAVPDIARIVTGRFRTLEDAEQVLRDGVADIVHMTRAHIADPDIVRKTRAGVPEQVRPCIGCNQGCWHNRNRGMLLGCTVNPAAGREGQLAEELIVPTDRPRKVLVVGGGPAGMEAARVAALCGHEVTLVEASSQLGGQIFLARRAPRLHTIGDIAAWLEQEIFRLGVEVRLGSYFEADDVAAEQADLVVVATGALPRENGIQYAHPENPVPGFGKRHVLSAMDLFASPNRPPAKHALVFDEVGHYEAIAATEHLLQQGTSVTFVTPFRMMGPMLDPDSRVETAFARFAGYGGFTLMTRSHLTAIGDESCEVRTVYREDPANVPAELVLFITAKEPMRSLYDDLRARGYAKDRNIAIIGDAQAPRDLQYAILEGHRAIRAWHDKQRSTAR
jgi:2,4-dienoyl-CoA reductase-like NADH-dependent reductase (Old Yellow Enzyme family)